MALRDFTAEFGMGSGVGPLAMATKSSKRSVFCVRVFLCEVKCLIESRVVGLTVMLAHHLPPPLGELCRYARASKGKEIKPNERLVPVGCTHCCAFTPGLST